MLDAEQTIAIVYLHQADDQDNKCMLTSQRVMVVYRGKLHSFERQHIKSIASTQRRLLLPLITGGIIAPLSLLAIFMNLYNPWPLMLAFFLGSALFYIGLQRHPVLTITDTVKDHDFFLTELTSNLKEFIAFAQQVVFGGGSHLYLPLSVADWARYESEAYIKPLPNQDFKLFNRSQIVKWKQQRKLDSSWVVLQVDLLEVKSTVRYQAPKGKGELFAFVSDKIEQEAITGKEFI